MRDGLSMNDQDDTHDTNVTHAPDTLRLCTHVYTRHAHLCSQGCLGPFERRCLRCKGQEFDKKCPKPTKSYDLRVQAWLFGDRWLFGIPEPPRAMELSVVLDFARKSSHVSILPMSSAAIRPVHTSRCQRARPPTRCRFFAQNNRVDKVDHSIFQDCIIINILTLTMIKMRVGASCGLVMSCSASMA